ncbi:hypothetical protein BGW39_002417 [Mortierella sp. 14UC]|nr:hypothetical protein BGW39_002417 [Mortierella sp. 14UC]
MPDIAAGSAGGDVHIFEVSTGEPKMTRSSGIPIGHRVAYLPDSNQVVSSHGPGGARLWDEQHKDSRDIFFITDSPNVIYFAFSSCGQWAVTGDALKAHHVWRRSSSLGKTPEDWNLVTTVEGCFGAISEITWRPNKLEFATSGDDGSTRARKVVEEPDRVSMQLVWGFGGTALAASGASLAGSVGLSAANRKLLEQRGAIVRSSSQEDRA